MFDTQMLVFCLTQPKMLPSGTLIYCGVTRAEEFKLLASFLREILVCYILMCLLLLLYD